MNNYENKLCNHHDYGYKGTEFPRFRQQIRAIPEEIALYFDVSQKTCLELWTCSNHRRCSLLSILSLTALDLQRPSMMLVAFDP